MLIQKPLSWVQRFLYHIAAGTLPPVGLQLSIDQDWPLETLLLKPADYVTIAGTVTTTLYDPGPERHGLAYLGTVSTVAVAVPNTDLIGLLLRDFAGDGARAWESANQAIPVGEMMPLVGAIKASMFSGVAPIYVAPGQQLRLLHGSIAGGSTMRARLWVIDRPSSYPLRLP